MFGKPQAALGCPERMVKGRPGGQRMSGHSQPPSGHNRADCNGEVRSCLLGWSTTIHAVESRAGKPSAVILETSNN